MWLVLEYLIVATLVVFCAIKASKYIDMLDKTTKLSGAFLGGVLLSSITSLPELITSISATMLIDEPQLCLSNMLGSNIFNTAILALVLTLAIKRFKKTKVSRGNIFVTITVLSIYAVLIADMFNFINYNLFEKHGIINVVSLAIVAFYLFGVRYLAQDNECECGQCEDDEEITLTTRQIAVRFTLTSIVLVGLSVLMTYITDDIATEFGLGSGLAGAIFLGVATSLPEVSSTIALVRMRNFNIAIGNIVGSNLFNFVILFVADLLYIKGDIYDYSDLRVVSILEFGMFATLALLALLCYRKKWIKIVAAIAVMACYIASLLR